MVDHLVNMLPNLNIVKETITIDNLVSKASVLLLRLKKAYEAWPKEFYSEWSGKAKEKMIKAATKRLEQAKRNV